MLCLAFDFGWSDYRDSRVGGRQGLGERRWVSCCTASSWSRRWHSKTRTLWRNEAGHLHKTLALVAAQRKLQKLRNRSFFHHYPTASSKHEDDRGESVHSAVFHLAGVCSSRDPIPNWPTYCHAPQLRLYSLLRHQTSPVPASRHPSRLPVRPSSILLSLELTVSPCVMKRKGSYAAHSYRAQMISASRMSRGRGAQVVFPVRSCGWDRTWGRWARGTPTWPKWQPKGWLRHECSISYLIALD